MFNLFSTWTGDRITERTRKAMLYAKEEAGRLGCNYVETEHLLFGLVREGNNTAVRLLDRMGVSGDRIRSEVDHRVSCGEARPDQDIPLGPRAKRVIDLAYDESRQLKNSYIGTEHLLLGLVREGEGTVAKVLLGLGVTLERVRSEVRLIQDPTAVGPQSAQAVPQPR